jgi:hypothetical protein
MRLLLACVLLLGLPAFGLAGPALTLTPTQSIVVTVTGGPGTKQDWIGLYAVGAADAAWIDWARLNGVKTNSGPALTSGGATFKVPATGGPWEIRFFQGTGYLNKLLTSPPFGGAVTLTVKGEAPGSTFTGWSGDPRCTSTVPLVLTTDLTCTATFSTP